MGCFYSKDDEHQHIPSRINRQDLYCATTTTTYSRPIRITVPEYRPAHSITGYQRNTQRQQPKKVTEPRPKLGEYKCICGRFWTSRYCWPKKYQNCKKCKRQVYPHSYRDLQPSDDVKDDEKHPHEKELCQMCQQLGYSCTTKNTRRYNKKIY